MSEVKAIWRERKEDIVIFFQVLVIPVFFWFDARIRDLEQPSAMQQQRIEQIEKKLDHLIDLNEANQKAQIEFYKEYAPALEYVKREMAK